MDFEDIIFSVGTNNVSSSGDGNDLIVAVSHSIKNQAQNSSTNSNKNGTLTKLANMGWNISLSGDGDDVAIGVGNYNILSGGDGNDNLWAGQLPKFKDTSNGSAFSNLNNRATNFRLKIKLISTAVEYLENGDEVEAIENIAGKSNFNLLLGGDGDDTLWTKGKGNVLNGGDGNDTISANGHLNIAIGGDGDDYIETTGIFSFVNAGIGNDSVFVEDVGSTIFGGEGDDLIALGGIKGGIFSTLDGGAGNDTYVINTDLFQLSTLYSATYIDNSGDVNTTDTFLFAGEVSASGIKFQKSGATDLEVGIVGTNRHLILKDWYVEETQRIDKFQINDGVSLGQSEVQSLVGAWDAFFAGNISQGELNLTVNSTWV